MNRPAEFIGIASGIGARDPGCQDGPDVLQSLGFLQELEQQSWLDPAARILRAPHRDDSTPLQTIAALSRQLADRVGLSLQQGHFPLVIGGDHSCAIGTWSGVRNFMAPDQALGLIWIDAHMDSHTFATSESQAIHGMPLACLLGHGDPALTAIGGIGSTAPKLRAADVCLIGVRSYESGEAALLERLGVRVYFMDEIRRRGLEAVLIEAQERVARNTHAWGISIDLDALDPIEEPGVGSPVPGGLFRAELIAAMRRVCDSDTLCAMEIVEYNPYADAEFQTADTVCKLCRVVIE
ncbi:MAG TPA: arginase [Rhodocyclaceae bacterium]|nr:arginase [Rhodocyclaceae bacterium]